MKGPVNKSNVKRIAWVLKYMDSKGDTYTCPFSGILTRYLPEAYTVEKLKEDIQVLRTTKNSPGIVPGFCLFAARLQHSSRSG